MELMRTRRTAALGKSSNKPNEEISTKKEDKGVGTHVPKSARKNAGASDSEVAPRNAKEAEDTHITNLKAKAQQQSSTGRCKNRRSEGAVELAKDSTAPARRKKARAAPEQLKAAFQQRDDEVEEASDKHQTPQKHSANRDTHQVAPAAYQEELSDNDEAPEEVSMAVGKAGAAQQRQQESEAAAAKRAAAKARAKRRAAVAAEQKADRDAQWAAKAQHVAGQQQTSTTGQRSEQDDEEDDLLPPEVLDAMAKQSREAERARLLASAATPAAAKAGRKAKHDAHCKDLSQPCKVGPVYLQILDKIPEPKVSDAAKSFVQQRIFGGGTRRSAEMLVSTSRGLKAQGQPSAYRGSAL